MTFRRLTILVLLVLTIAQAWAQSVVITQLDIVGNARTKEKVILRELGFTVGDSMEIDEVSERLLTAKNRLMNLNLFNEVVVLSEAENNTLSIRIAVMEKWYIWPIPFVEFSDRNFNVWHDLLFDKNRTNFGMYLFNYNLFGLNHTAKVSIGQGYNEKLGLVYRVPFLGGDNQLGFDFMYLYESQNEVWRSTTDNRLQFYNNGSLELIRSHTFEVGLKQRFGNYIDQRLSIGGEHTQITDEVREASEVPFFQGDSLMQWRMHLSYGIVQDRQDNHYLPMLGSYKMAKISAEQYNEAFNLTFATEWKSMSELAENWYSAVSVYGEYNSNPELAYYNNRMLGYDRFLRGFESYVIEGNFALHLQSAIRYHALKNHQFKLPWFPAKNYKSLPFNMYLSYFIEGGLVSNQQRLNQGNDLINKPIWSTGIGLQSLFYNDRLIRFEYSMNSLSQFGFYIHFKKAI